MKRILALAVAVLLGISLLTPLPAAAEEAKEPAAAEETPAAEKTTDSYFQIPFLLLQQENRLLLPESMSSIRFSEPKNGNGLLMKGKIQDLTSGRITLDQEFDFNRNPVGRVSVDGLSDRDAQVSVLVFLDEEEEPAAEILLGSQMGKKEWANAGDRTADVSDKQITGKHKVSIQLNITGKAASKKTSVLLRNLEFAESSLPVLFFHIDESRGSIAGMNGSEDHSAECYGTVDLEIPKGYVSEYTGEEVTSLKGLELEYLRGRGNSTWYADKKPYKVKFSKKQNLFGMGANKHWILLANRYDNSFVRNRMTYWLGAQLGMEYTPQCVPVEVVMNGTYYGTYLLCEQIRVGEGRVEIDDLEESDESIRRTDEPFITGGYLLSMNPDSSENPDNMFETERGVSLLIESPAYEDYNNETQQIYIRSYLQAAEDAMFGENFQEAGGKSYTEYLDLKAAADYWWVQEFSANGDAYGSGSTYLYKKRDGKIFWGPLWDFDYVAWGDLDYGGEVRTGLDNTGMVWFNRMLLDPAFRTLLMERWNSALKDHLEEIIKTGGLLDRYYEETKTAAAYDREKWGVYDEGYDGYDHYAHYREDDNSENTTPEKRSYLDEINQLRSWIQNRKDWVEENLEELKPRTVTVTFTADGTVIKKMKLSYGEELTDLPKAPKKKGYVFAGWYNKNYGLFYSGSSVYDNLKLKARYIKKSQVIQPEHLYFASYDVYLPFYGWEDDECAYYPSYTVMPINATNTEIAWSSSRPKVAEVDEFGNVLARKVGTTKITGTLSNGTKASYKLHVYDANNTDTYYQENLTFNKTSVKLYREGYTQVRAIFAPQPISYSNLTWISLDNDIASVDFNGVITGHKAGKTVIVAVDTESRLSASCTVTVRKESIQVHKAKKAKVKPSAKTVSGNKVRLSWTAVRTVSGYEIYRAASKNGTYKKVGTLKKGTASKWTSEKLDQGTWYFKVRPYTKIGKKTFYGAWSPVVNQSV